SVCSAERSCALEDKLFETLVAAFVTACGNHDIGLRVEAFSLRHTDRHYLRRVGKNRKSFRVRKDIPIRLVRVGRKRRSVISAEHLSEIPETAGNKHEREYETKDKL